MDGRHIALKTGWSRRRLFTWSLTALCLTAGSGLVYAGLAVDAVQAGPQNPNKKTKSALDGLGKLQFNVWAPPGNSGHAGAYGADVVVLFFDPADPTTIVGGSMTKVPAFVGNSVLNVVSGTLLPQTLTPAPGDYVLHFTTFPIGNGWTATVALDVLADGTVDLRGVSAGLWPAGFYTTDTAFILEGTGSANVALPAR
jgi:hypothetical protein